MAEKDDVFTITGELRDAARQPVAGAIAWAVDLDRAAEGRILGEAATDPSGQFRITYRRADFVRSMAEALGKAGPWLVLRISDSAGHVLLAPRARPGAGRTEHFVLALPDAAPAAGPAARAIAFWSERLGDRSIESLADLRLLADAEPPPASGFAAVGGRDAQRLRALADLSRFFAADIAAALEEAGADTIDAVLAWPSARIAGALTLGGLTAAEQQAGAARIEALRAAAPLPANGLGLDLGGDEVLPEADRETLRVAGIAMLEDWAVRRESLQVGTDTRVLLDAHVRLAACGAAPGTSRALIGAGIASAHALAAADPVALAAETGLEAAVLAPVIVAASDRVAALPVRLAASLLHASGTLPAWLDRHEPRAGDLAAGWRVLDAAVAPELPALRAGRALVAVTTAAERQERRDALLERVALTTADGGTDLARALDVIRAFVAADMIMAGAADTAGFDAVSAALDRLTAEIFPDGSPARRPVATDTASDVGKLAAAWGFHGFDAGPPPELPPPFEEGPLDLAALGPLLDACLALAFHLRVAELPLAMAQEAAGRGDRGAALAALDRFDAAIAVHPWASPRPAALCPVASADERLAQLHRGQVLARLAAGGDTAGVRLLEALHGRAVPQPSAPPADVDAIAVGGLPAAEAAAAHWRKVAFHTRPRPRDPDIVVEAELQLPVRFDPSAPALDAAVAQRVLDAWYVGACFRPGPAAMAQLLSASSVPADAPVLADMLARHRLAVRAQGLLGATLDQPLQAWEAAAAGAARAGSPPLRIAFEDWLEGARDWQAASVAAIDAARLDLAAAIAAERRAALREAAIRAGGVALPAGELPAATASTAREASNPERQAAQTMVLRLSLAERAPVAVQALRTGPGRLFFRTAAADLRRVLPGARVQRLDGMRIVLDGVPMPGAGIIASLMPQGERTARLLLSARGRGADAVALAVPRPALSELPRETLDLGWCLDIPKAANRIDFDRLADVIVELRLRVLLPDEPTGETVLEVRGERLVSLRREVPAAWARLTNAVREPALPPLAVTLPIDPSWFPPHLERLRLTEATAQLLGAAAGALTHLTLRRVGQAANGLPRAAGGQAALDGGVASTRRPDVIGEHPWHVLRGLPPSGDWTIELPDDPAVRGALADGGIADLVLTLGYAGALPAWPN